MTPSWTLRALGEDIAVALRWPAMRQDELQLSDIEAFFREHGYPIGDAHRAVENAVALLLAQRDAARRQGVLTDLENAIARGQRLLASVATESEIETARENWRATHVITLSDDSGPVEVILVQLVDGAAYTREEWEASATADWTRDDDGSWRWQDRVAPRSGLTVTVRATGPVESSIDSLSTFAAALDAAGEADVAHRVELLRACRAAVEGEVQLLRLFARTHLDPSPRTSGELRRAARAILSQYEEEK